jgi:branched-chain amino acid aminotransferase
MGSLNSLRAIPMFINFNGEIIRPDKAVLTADNRSFRYGDGLFETIKVCKGRILLDQYHFDRLMAGVSLLQFQPPSSFTAKDLSGQILELCSKNGHTGHARVRLVVFRGNGGLHEPSDHLPNYIIQTWALAGQKDMLPAKAGGWAIDVFPDGRKSCDSLSNLKSNNYLIYVLAALYARKMQVDDCLVLNHHGRIADSTIANLFYCKNGKIYTPPLSEGGVAGVMRRFLMETIPGEGFQLAEKETTLADLESADEVFLTNALQGIRWVRSFRGISYTHQLTTAICELLISKNVC